MSAHLRANLWLLALTVLLCSVLYPAILWGVGQTLFHDKAQGSMLVDVSGNAVGSRLIGQPFTADEYFQPRPSAVSYNAAASGASNWAASNYLLRDRVARQLGPIVRYSGGPKMDQLVGPDIERWFQNDRFGGKSGIVAQWATAHPAVAQNWVKADKKNAACVSQWQNSHPDAAAERKTANPEAGEPKTEDLATPFFVDFSKKYPGTFPVVVEQKTPDGKTESIIQSAREDAEIQRTFFDMWLQEHNDAPLATVPGDMVTSSGSGLDPNITLENALWQLDRVATAWARKTAGDRESVHREIELIVRQHSHAPLGGLVGLPMVNVLEVNLAIHDRFER